MLPPVIFRLIGIFHWKVFAGHENNIRNTFANLFTILTQLLCVYYAVEALHFYFFTSKYHNKLIDENLQAALCLGVEKHPNEHIPIQVSC
jgi:hypothetical protein